MHMGIGSTSGETFMKLLMRSLAALVEERRRRRAAEERAVEAGEREQSSSAASTGDTSGDTILNCEHRPVNTATETATALVC